jgi:N-acetylneuraminic acid mutarotase
MARLLWFLFALLALCAATATAANATAGPWVRKADMPVGEQNAAIAKVGHTIYLIGGYENEKIVRIYDPAADTWSTAPYSLPRGRWGAAVTTVHRHILLFGGGHGDFDFLGTRGTYDVDPAEGTVTRRARAPVPLELAAAAHIPRSDRVLVVGGHEQQEVGPRLKHTPVYIYDASDDAWHRRGNLPVKHSLIGGTVVVSHRHIYYYGGVVDIAFGPASRAVFRYHLRTDRWERVSTLPKETDVTAGAATGADGRIYVVGSGPNLRWVQVFNPDTATWSPGRTIPSTLGPRSVIALDGTIYAMGGGLEVQGELFVAGWNWAMPTMS